MSPLAWAVATWFGCGKFPWGPGTAGSLAAILIAFVLRQYFGTGRLLLVILIGVLLGPAIWASTRTARDLHLKDPGVIVVDEVLGQWTTLLGAAVSGWKAYLAAFLLFRIFDIWKPGPIRQLERLPDGYGIMADDLAAGILGALILYIGRSLQIY